MVSVRVLIEKKWGRLPYLLTYTIVEWVVIILLLVDGFLAFLSNEIARVFELRIPCLLCTRLDHVLVHRDSNFYYNDSMCEIHKKGISALTYCHEHEKLSDIRSMCHGCLLSEKDSDCNVYKSIVGVLHKDVDFLVEDEQRLLLKKDDAEIPSDEKPDLVRCCCCGDYLKSKSSLKFNRSLSIDAPAPSPRALWFPSKSEEGSNLDLPQLALLADAEDMNDDVAGPPILTQENKFSGIPLSEGATISPRRANMSSRKLPSDKLGFLLEPIDVGNEADGDILTRLKRQVNMDRRSLMALYMELDEERSASAIAVNNAMEMITSLQAKKAAVQMEALQYQRMMEEQAEYFQEAMRMMKDMEFKREEEIKVLEVELELYKAGGEICEVDVDEHSKGLFSFSEKSESSEADHTENEHIVGGDGDQLSFDFGGEKSYLLGNAKSSSDHEVDASS